MGFSRGFSHMFPMISHSAPIFPEIDAGRSVDGHQPRWGCDRVVAPLGRWAKESMGNFYGGYFLSRYERSMKVQTKKLQKQREWWKMMVRLSEIWLVVWLPFFIFPYIGNNHPNWRNHIFQRGGPTTNQKWWMLMDVQYQYNSCAGGSRTCTMFKHRSLQDRNWGDLQLLQHQMVPRSLLGKFDAMYMGASINDGVPP